MQEELTLWGVDIIQHCEVTGFDVQNGKIQGVQNIKREHQNKKNRIMCSWKYIFIG